MTTKAERANETSFLHSHIPISYDAPLPPGKPLTDRANDVAPFYTGAAISGPTGVCGLGFKVSYNSGNLGMITAAHCGSGRFTTLADSASGEPSRDVGSTVRRQPNPSDAQIVDGQTYDTYAWTGAWNSAFSRPVYKAPATITVTGKAVCSDGAITGKICTNLVTLKPNALYCPISTSCYGPGFRVQNQAGDCAAQSGDSGSPVLTINSDSAGSVTIYGMIDEGVYEIAKFSCGGNPGVQNNDYYDYFAVNVSTI